MADRGERELSSSGRDEDLAGSAAVASSLPSDPASAPRERELAAILDESLDEMYLFDFETLHFLEVNRGARENLGYTMDDLSRLTPLDLKPDFTQEQFEEILHPLRTGAADRIRFETRHRRKDGSLYPVEVFLQVFPFNGAKVFGAMILDVTERKRTEEELQRYRSHLEELVESRTRELMESREQLRHAERLASIGTLAAGIAHEINNPIGSILASAQFALLSNEDEGASPRDALRQIEQQAIRCGQIVKSVLQFSRNQPTERWERDLGEVVGRVQDAAGPYAARVGVAIHSQLTDEPLTVSINPMEIEQAILNLVHNAVESDSADGVVKIRCWRKLHRAYVEVSDHGRGIAPADLRRVFDPFYTTRMHAGGTGLGLSVTHGIVTGHGGTLVADSQVGVGTTMTLELPLVDAPELEARQKTEA